MHLTVTRRRFLQSAALLPAASLAPSRAHAALPDNPPSIGNFDVIVAGAGPAGLAAATAAARLGAKTLLVEQAGCAGGMATSGLIGPFMTCYDKSGSRMIIRGLFAEIVDRLIAKNGAIHPSKITAPSPYTAWITHGHAHCTPFDPEKLKLVADELLASAGVKILYHTSVVKTLRPDNSPKIASLLLHSKNGLRSAIAKIYIDCTGDGDLAASAGVPFDLGNPQRKSLQPASLFFRVGNCDDAALEAEIAKHIHTFHRKNNISYRAFHWLISKAREAGDWDLARASINIFKGSEPGTWTVNTTRINGVDGTDAESLTHGEIEGRRQVQTAFNFIKKYLPGCQNALLLSTAATLGIRESRHIHGDYTLTPDDVIAAKVPDDSILIASNSIDIHGRGGPMSTEYKVIEGGDYYGIPWRCLLPLGLDNLLLAGRCVSAASDAAGAIRVMPPCMATGQAAGTAAALVIRDNLPSPRSLDIRLLRQTLSANGVVL